MNKNSIVTNEDSFEVLVTNIDLPIDLDRQEKYLHLYP